MKSILWLCLTFCILLGTLSTPFVHAQNSQVQGPNGTGQYADVTYGPIDTTDTLWRIADSYRQGQNVSVYQVMLAIYELNPNAFETNNFNEISNGATLRMPSFNYVRRINIQRARGKAELDDKDFASRGGKVVPPGAIPEPEEPEIPLVNQNDLSQTQAQLQRQLSVLNQAQNKQFDAIQTQVAASINTVQALIDENKKMYNRLDQVNTELSDLRNKVEQDVQPQVNEQLVLQRQLIEMMKEKERKQLEKENKSFSKILSSPIFIISASLIFTLLLLGVITYVLLKKSPTAPAQQTKKAAQSDEIAPLPEMDSESDDNIAPENNNSSALDDLPDEEDDILSDELEDALGDDDMDDFDSLSDEMLVPDQVDDDMMAPSDEIDDTDSVDLDLDDLDDDDINLSGDDIDLSDDDIDLSGDDIDLSDDDIDLSVDDDDVDSIEQTALDNDDNDDNDDSVEENTDVIDLVSDDDDVDIDSIVEKERDESVVTDPADNAQEKELSIDDLIDGELPQTDLPQGITLDDSGKANDTTLAQIEASIAAKNDEINAITSSLMEEISQIEMMGGVGAASVDSEDDKNSYSTDTQEASEIIEKAKENKASESHQQREEDDEDEADDIDDILEESLASMDTELSEGNSVNNGTNPIDEDLEDEQDHIADELLAELESSTDIDHDEDDSDDDFNLDDDETLNNTIDSEKPEEASEIDSEVQAQLDELLAAELDSHDVDDDFSLDENEEADDAVESELNESELANEHLEDSILETRPKENDSDILGDLPSFANDDLESDTEQEPENDDQTSYPDEQQSSRTEPTSDAMAEQDTQATNESELKEKSNNDRQKNTKPDDIKDELFDLPGLDDWLDTDDKVIADNTEEAINNSTNDVNNQVDGSIGQEDSDILSELENTDFDSLLKDMESISDSDNSVDSKSEVDNSDVSTSLNDLLDVPDLDLDALLQEDEEGNDFVDVDDLLADSDNAQPELDDDLSLESSLDGLLFDGDASNPPNASESDTNADLASSLDLARVYIDMDDKEAAKELLEEVATSDNEEFKTEAMELLSKL